MARTLRTLAAAALCAAGPAAGPLAAQSVRLHGTTTTQYVQLRPIQYDPTVIDTIGTVVDTGAYVSLPVAEAAPFTQDLEVSAWGLGVSGLRAYALLRGRAALGSDLVWPESDTHFEALYAYLELERPRYLLRLGRQQRASGLGFYGFDGLTAAWRPLAALRIEGYGGRGLARASMESFNSSAIASLDPLRPDLGTILLGASVWAAPSPRSTFTATYQRELLSDRSGLVSELAAFDGRVGVGSHLILSGSANADVARRQWGKASISAMYLVSPALSVQVEAFQYRPTLDLSSIWGVFTPEAHAGYSASANVTVSRDLSFNGGFTYRHWQPLSSGSPFLADVGNYQRELTLGSRARLGSYTLDGSYHLEIGFGGDESAGDLSAAYAPAGSWSAGVRTTAFQQTDMFRVASGTVYGLGGTFRTPLGRRLELSADLMRYLHRRLGTSTGVDWNQTRLSVTFDWTMGADADRVAAYQ